MAEPTKMIPDDWWNNGLCSTFAAALQKRYGGEMWAVVNHSRKYPDDDNLCHCYCVINGLAYDCTGPHPITEASDLSDCEVPDMDRDCDVVFQWRKVDTDWLGKMHEDYNPNGFPEAFAYMDRNPQLFPLTRKIEKAVVCAHCGAYVQPTADPDAFGQLLIATTATHRKQKPGQFCYAADISRDDPDRCTGSELLGYVREIPDTAIEGK